MELGDWIGRILGYEAGTMQPYAGIGFTLDGQPVAAGVVNQVVHYEHGATGMGSIASTTPRWANRRTLRALFAVPFLEVGLTRLMTLCPADRDDLRAFNNRLGFTFEGIGRRAHDGVKDAAAFSMLPEECRWLQAKEVRHG